MSSFIDLAMQNSQAEQARKKRKKEDIESALLGGGMSGGSGTSSQSSSNAFEDNNPSYSQQVQNAYSNSQIQSSGLGSILADTVKQTAAQIVDEKLQDVAGKFAKEGLEKVAEKAVKELGEDSALAIAGKCAGKFATKAIGFGGKLTNALGWTMLAKDGLDSLALLTTGKDMDGLLSEDIDMDIQKEKDDLYEKALAEGMSERDAMNLSHQAYAGIEQAQSFRDGYQWVKKGMSDIGDSISEGWDNLKDSFKKDDEEKKKKKEEEEKKKKEMLEAEKKKKEAEEKIKKEQEKEGINKQNQSNSKSDDEDEADSEEDSSNFSKTPLARGLKSGLLHTAATFGGSAAISFSMIGMYRIHYTNEFEYKGISAEYQRVSKDFQNMTGYDGDGNVVLTGLSRENKLLKTFYTKYSDKSYYAIVEDSKKYSDENEAYKRKNLLTPDELREQYPDIEDVNGREVMFQLNPDVLYALDKYIHNDKVLYPQQFVKPVYYEESKDKFGLKDLADKNGTLLAKSQSFDSSGKPIKNANGSFKTEPGIWDYGFAPILRYQEHEVKQRSVKNPVKRDIKIVGEKVRDGNLSGAKKVDKAPESGAIPGGETVVTDKGLRKEPAYIIDTAVTPGGTITNKIESQWIKDASSISNTTNTFKQAVWVGEEDAYCPIPQEPNTGESAGNGSTGLAPVSVDSRSKEVPDGMQVCGKVAIYDIYEVTDHYETYMEEYLPQYVGDPSTKQISGSKYFRDYMTHYSNYFPTELPTRLDFRVLDNEEIAKLIYDDVPGSISSGGQNTQQGNLTGQTFEAEFTGYYPSNDPMQGGYNDAKGNPLDPSKNTCAAPWTSDYPKSLLTYGSQIQIQGTGTNKDGVVCTINDKGGAIKLIENPDGSLKYKIDILFPSKKAANDFGRRQGQIIIPTGGVQVASINDAVSSRERTPETLMNNYERSQMRTAGLIVNTGGNAVTNYGMSIDDYAQARASYMAGKSCDSNNCTLANYRENLEPMAFQDKVGDLRHLRLDSYRPVNEEVFKQMFSKMFDKIGQYGGSLIEAGKQANVDIVVKASQMAIESGWGKRAIVGQIGGRTYYNFAGIGAYDGDAYNKGLQYAMKQGWDTPEKGMLGVIEFVSKKYIYNEEYKQNTLYKFQFAPSDYKRFYASNPDYAYGIANLMQNSIIKRYPDIYAPNAQFYFDFPEFDPNKPVGTIEGAGYVPGGGGSYSSGGTPNTAFNSYLASNWSAIESVWDDLFPGQSELDKKLDMVKKGDYTNLYNNYEEKARYMQEPGQRSKANSIVTLKRASTPYSARMTDVDKQLTLNMMFALNQGNYLFKYDQMTEMEWKAMYTQLLSSPTGKTWDDKWIGYNKEDIFGIEEIGKLFPEDNGVSPVISVPYGMEKNSVTGDSSVLSHYNYVNFGIDIVVPPDTEVLTVADGKVISVSKKANMNSRYGNYVEIKHANGTVTMTANLKTVKVSVGDNVKLGDVIGTSGGECKSYKDNAIHYQIRHKGELINPTWVITGEMTGFDDPISGNNGVYCGGASVETSNNPVVNNALSIARQQIGKPYVWGATGPNSFDCSGFMYYIMKEAGVPGGRRVAYGYYKESMEVPREQIQPGDFVFWHDLKGTRHSPVYHIGVYMGNGEVIDCSPDHKGVGIRKLEDLVDKPGNRRFTFGRYAPFVGSSGGGVSTGGVCSTGGAGGNALAQAEYKWPVPSSSSISTPFGDVKNPDTGKKENHTGIDITGSSNTEIVASKAGKVIFAGTDGDYGNIVRISHDDGKSETWYAHNSENLVKEGDEVTQGQTIAKMGSTGSAKKVHLHFEVRFDGEPKNPTSYVKP